MASESVSAPVPTISSLLRARELAIKKVTKDVNGLVTHSTVVGDAATPVAVGQAPSVLQSIYDHLANICSLTSNLRRFNLSTLTDATDYFTGNRMNISECRQNVVAGKNVGLPSVLFHLQTLHNTMQAQAKQVLAAVKHHNAQEKANLTRILNAEHAAYLREEESLRQLGSVPTDFKATYDAKVARMETAFWEKNTATLIDPLELPSLLSQLAKWLDDFEKQRDIKINRANSGAVGHLISNPPSDSPSVSLEELMALVKDQNNAINTAISRLVVVSWRVADRDPMNLQVEHARESYDNVCRLIKAYGVMQSVLRSATTLTLLSVTNPLNGSAMSAIDVVDFQHVVVPVLRRVLKIVEKQKTTATDYVKSSESTVRTDVVKLVESNLGTASSRPTPEKIKEYTTGLLESLMPRLVTDPRTDGWVAKYTELLDTFDSTVKPSLSTANANTRVTVVWDKAPSCASVPTWDDMGLDAPLRQAEIASSAPMFESLEDDLDGDVDIGGWESSATWGGGARIGTERGGRRGGRGKAQARSGGRY